MTVAYLDTSHLHLLATERSRGSTAFTAFLDVWRKGGWELGLSHFHFMELARYGAAEGREARYALFQELAPVWLTVPAHSNVRAASTLVRREILHVLAARGLAKSAQSIPGRQGIAFVERVNSRDVRIVRALEGGELRGYIDAFHQAVSLAAEASQRPPGSEADHKRLRDIGNRILTAEEVKAIRDALDPQFAKAFADLGIEIPVEAREQAIAQVQGKLNEFLDRAAQDGVQKALATYLSSAGAEISLRSPIEGLIHEHVFADELRQTLIEDVGVTDEDLIKRAVSQTKLADCPGTWLSREVSKALAAAEPAPAPGSTYDLEHLGYLPYVEVLFTDKRIAEYARQVLRRDGIPQTLKDVRPPQAIASTIAGIQTALTDSMS